MSCVEDYFSKEQPNKPVPDRLNGPKWPVVHFHKGGHTLLLTPTKFDVINGLGQREATREQVNFCEDGLKIGTLILLYRYR